MAEMTAHPADELLADLAAEVLAPHDAEPVRAHVDRCVTCADVVRAISDVGDALQAVPEPPLPAGLHDRVLQAVRHAEDPLVGAEQETTPHGDVVAVLPLAPAGRGGGTGDVPSANAAPGARPRHGVRARRLPGGGRRGRWGPLLGAAAALLFLGVVGLGQITGPGVQTTAGPPPAPEAGPGAVSQGDARSEPQAAPDDVPDETSERAVGEDVPSETGTFSGEVSGGEAGREDADGNRSGTAPLGGLPVFTADPGPVSPDTVLQSIRRRPELARAYEAALDAGSLRNEGAGSDPLLTSCPGVAESGGTPAFFLASDGTEPATVLVVVLPGGAVAVVDATPEGCAGLPDAGGGVAPGSN